MGYFDRISGKEDNVKKVIVDNRTDERLLEKVDSLSNEVRRLANRPFNPNLTVNVEQEFNEYV